MKLEKKIGSGAFSIVKLVTDKATKEQCAMKIIDKVAVGKEKKEMLDREVDILKRVQHPHIVRILRIFENEKYMYLIMELATGGELFDEIVKRGKYTEKSAARLVRQIAFAINYLHGKGILFIEI